MKAEATEKRQPAPAAKPNQPQTEPKKPAEKKPEGASFGAGRSPFRLAAYQQPAPGGKKSAAPPLKPEAAPAKPPAEKKPAEVPAAKPAEKQAEKPMEKPAAKPAEKPAEKPAAPPPPEPWPSKRLKEFIRGQIAREKVQTVFNGLSEQMDKYRDQKNEYEFGTAAKKAGKTAPKPLDFDKLAKEHGITAGKTGLVAAWQAGDTEVGNAYKVDYIADDQGNPPARWGAIISQYAFHSMAKLRPEMAVDPMGNDYLVWKTEDAREEVPKFEDQGVREEVLRAWKMIDARKLALKEAESLAALARKDSKPLALVFAGRPKLHVLTPPPFTWMTGGSVSMSYSQRAVVSNVEGINYAGDEFMRTVFDLEPGQVGAAMNAPETTAYVVQLNALYPSFKVLWNQFTAVDFRTYQSVGQGDRNRMVAAWLKEIKTDADFKWTKEHTELMKKESTQSGIPASSDDGGLA